MALTIEVNGEALTVDAEPGTPLLWVLRETLNLKGTKFGCGAGLCGACTVHLNGKPTRSCITPVRAVGNGSVTTIEGIGTSEAGRRLQAAWVEHDVPQCGYCQAGQIMAAAALLLEKSKPDDTDINQAMSSNLCRCGTYTRIRRAIHAAAGPAGTSQA